VRLFLILDFSGFTHWTYTHYLYAWAIWTFLYQQRILLERRGSRTLYLIGFGLLTLDDSVGITSSARVSESFLQCRAPLTPHFDAPQFISPDSFTMLTPHSRVLIVLSVNIPM